jgi:capsular polysaccharide transport system ATP-binding protein
MKLIDILTGVARPERGVVLRDVRVSFPVGFLGGFDDTLSVGFNLKHVARLYGTDPRQFVTFVSGFLGDRRVLEHRLKELSHESRRKLASVVGLGLPFDTYVFNFGNGGARLLKLEPSLYSLFQARVATSGIIIGSQDLRFVREYCDCGLVFDSGRLEFIEDLAEAMDRFRFLAGRRSART